MHSDNSQLVAARGIAGAWGFGTDTVTLSLSPFSHNLGCGNPVGRRLSSAVNSSSMTGRVAKACSTISRMRVSTISLGVPTHAMDLLAELKARDADKYDRLKSFRVSAAACPEHVAAELYDYGIPRPEGLTV